MSLVDVAAGKKATLVMFLCVHCPFVVHLKGDFPWRGMGFATTTRRLCSERARR